MTDENESSSIALNLRVPPSIRDRLDTLVKKGLPFSRHRLAVLALDHGLRLIEADPTVLVRTAAPPRGQKRR